MVRSFLVSLVPMMLLSGCISTPMTPAELRDRAKVGSFYVVETFDVKRPFADVANTIAKKAPECLQYSLSSTEKPVLGFGSSTSTYAWAKPTVIRSAAKLELSFQMKFPNMVGTHPADGYYYLVADAYPAGKDTTKVDVYRTKMGGNAELIARSVRGWASGENLGCPDPT